jgi:23S rRNA G2445 N2-methylase RlmL
MSPPRRPVNPRPVRMFAATVPGLGAILAGEVGELPAASVTDIGADGRSELVLFDVDSAGAVLVPDLSVAEDVFLDAGRATRADDDTVRRLAGRIWRSDRIAPALSRWVRLRGEAATFRVVVRVRGERTFRRTDLRRELVGAIARDRPRWRPTDPARLEVWVLEYRPGRFVTGLRVSDATMRQHSGRVVERPGALRPAVAAAMVRLAGRSDLPLLDPCCGSGSILMEAARCGWTVRGIDIDGDAVRVARHNVPDAAVEVGDARHVALPDGSVAACVSNLPFGRRYGVQGRPAAWLRSVLAEMARLTRPGGRVVVLAPHVPAAAVPAGLRRRSRQRLRLLGQPTALWCFDRLGQR